MPLQATDPRLAPAAVPSGDAAGPVAPARSLRWTALGTTCEIRYVAPDDAVAAAFEAAAIDWVADFEARYSRFRPDSLLSRINAAAGLDWVSIDPETERLLDFCGVLHRLTRGTLDPTALPLLRLWDYRAPTPRIPADDEIAAARRLVGWHLVQREPGRVRLPLPGMALDFGGWGKEYAVDAVAALAGAHGIAHALIDFGHDIQALGAAPGKPAWHVGLEDPARPGQACWGSVALSGRAIASSGDYLRGFTLGGRRYGHIVDPRTGRPVAHGCLQVNVIASTCTQAGALATAAFILGPAEGIRLIEENPGAEACILMPGARHQTRGFFRHVVAA